MLRSHIAYPAPERGRHGEGARRPARRGRGAPHEGGARLRPGRVVRRARGRARAHEGGRGARRRGACGVGRAPGRLVGGASRRRGGAGRSTSAGVRATAGSTRCPTFAAGEQVATRDAGKTVMQAIKRFTPTMIGGAADLAESTKTEFDGGGVFARSHAGRNLAFGIREHAMGSIVNGIVLEPAMLKPYGVDLPRVLGLHAARRAPLGALRASRRVGRGRTTRSASARTGRRTSPSST